MGAEQNGSAELADGTGCHARHLGFARETLTPKVTPKQDSTKDNNEIIRSREFYRDEVEIRRALVTRNPG